jgi:hypothetical protein
MILTFLTSLWEAHYIAFSLASLTLCIALAVYANRGEHIRNTKCLTRHYEAVLQERYYGSDLHAELASTCLAPISSLMLTAQ